MLITCENCDYNTQYSGSDFRLAPENINYCMNCGTKFADMNTDSANLVAISYKRHNYYLNKLLMYFFLGMVSIALIIFALISKYDINTDPQNNLWLIIGILVSSIIWLIASSFIARNKSYKKFPVTIAD